MENKSNLKIGAKLLHIPNGNASSIWNFCLECATRWFKFGPYRSNFGGSIVKTITISHYLRPDFLFSFVIWNDFGPVWIVRIPKENSAKKMKKSNTIRNFCKSVRGQINCNEGHTTYLSGVIFQKISNLVFSHWGQTLWCERHNYCTFFRFNSNVI